MALQYQLKTFKQLTMDERDAWREFTSANATLWSPFFALEFMADVAAVTERLRIVVVRRGGEPVAFFPFLSMPLGYAQPAAGLICDMHGLIASNDDGIELPELMAAARASLYTFHGAPSEQKVFQSCSSFQYDSLAADLSGGYPAWLDRVISGGKKQSFKSLARKRRMLEQQVGPLRFELVSDSEAAFKLLTKWKSEQYRRSGHFDVLSVRWIRKLLLNVWRRRDPTFAGHLSTLSAGDVLLSVHFGMKTQKAANHWFPAYDRAFSKYSPGLLLQEELYKAWAQEGVLRVDCGGGETESKLQFTDVRIPMVGGLASRDSVAARAYLAANSFGNAIAKTPNAFIAKLPHRIGVRVRRHFLYRFV